MILLSKKIGNNQYYNFDKILISGYHIKEDNDRIIQKFANGHRKSINSSYIDCEIKIDLDTFDIDTTKEYLDHLTSGTYKYYSIDDKVYKETEFIIEGKPEMSIKTTAKDNILVDEYEIVLLKAGE